METKVDEIAERIYRFSTFAPEIAAPAGFTFNQFLIDADEPLLFHCGPRSLFPSVSKALGAIMPIEQLRWISFGHVEADECGSMNLWLAAAPQAQVVHGQTACMVSLNDLADRPPRALGNGEIMDIGGRRVRYIDTPHVPHAWESGLIYEETTRTLFCGDLLTQIGQGQAVTTESVLEAAIDGGERLSGHVADADDRPDDPHARGARAPLPGRHARLEFRRRLRRPALAAGGFL